MKKLAVIAAMTLLSLATITACGNKGDNTKENQTNVDNTNENNTSDNSSDNSETDADNNTEDPNDDSFGGTDPDSDEDYNVDDNNEDNTDDNSSDNSETDPDNNTENEDDKKDDNADNTNTDKKDTDKKDTDKKDNKEEEPVETGVEPDFKLNKKGCFNGSYEGNDGCTYKFTKKGKLIITSDSETLKYEYTLSDDVLSMVAEDGSFGTSRQITLLEDGTYLLDDKMGTQVILTYIES